MRFNLLKHNNLMLRSERRERLEAWAASDQPISHRQHYGLRRHRPIVGDVPHFAPSGAPPLGQNTETKVSFASQLAAPSDWTDLTVTGAASPLSPFSPGAP
jgi:hypothetical protein